jgi:hypothetical protein
MDNSRLERIEKKIDDIADHLSSIDITLAEQHISLKEHIKRTVILEKEMLPIKRQMYMIQGAAALLGALGAIAGLLKYIKFL